MKQLRKSIPITSRELKKLLHKEFPVPNFSVTTMGKWATFITVAWSWDLLPREEVWKFVEKYDDERDYNDDGILLGSQQISLRNKRFEEPQM